jgi:hypothetical protein
MVIECKYPYEVLMVKHPTSVKVNNYSLTLVDFKNVGHKNDPCMDTC